jgi:hypothetical protein
MFLRDILYDKMSTKEMAVKYFKNLKGMFIHSFIFHSVNPYKFITNLKDMEHVNISNAI